MISTCNPMISTGNDIVALTATDDDRTARYRFYSRVLTPDELGLHPAASPVPTGHPAPLPFPTFVWLMWSIKESVYKYISRADHGLVFSPLKIPVNQLTSRDGFYEGFISYGPVELYSRSFLQDGTILTVVSEEPDFAHTRWGLHAIPDPRYPNQSASVREYALQSLAAVLPDARLRIVKTPDGPPELWDGERRLDIPLSLAHHGHYVAWAYRLSANSSSYRKSAAN